MPPQITDLDLLYLDTPGAASAFLLRANTPILVECGPAACFETLATGLCAEGISPGDITDIILTHIHLDHAGAAGHFAQLGARIHVHPLGTKHLIDPTKLLDSSRRVHGDKYDQWYGDLLAIPPAQIREWQDGESGEIAGLHWTAHHTSGHARHHIAWQTGDELFTGDVGAMVIPHSDCISVPTPPPEFDPPAWRDSLARLRALSPEPARVWCTHGGCQRDGAAYLARAEQRVNAECIALAAALDAGAAESPEADCAYGASLSAIPGIEQVSPEARAHFLGRAFRRMNLLGAERARAKGLL